VTSVLNPIPVATDERFMLHGVSWETYAQLLKNFESCSVPRFTYDQGELEIMSPSLPHEEIREILVLLVNLICEELGIDVRGLGSITLKRADLQKGAEPDACFYIKRVKEIASIKELDLTIHPPSDLVIEVDIGSSSIDKFSIYAALGVPELWRFSKDEIEFFRLAGGQYTSLNHSLNFPRVSALEVTRLVGEARALPRPQWLSRARSWIRSLR